MAWVCYSTMRGKLSRLIGLRIYCVERVVSTIGTPHVERIGEGLILNSCPSYASAFHFAKRTSIYTFLDIVQKCVPSYKYNFIILEVIIFFFKEIGFQFH